MHYVDRDPAPESAVDFGCGRQTYDTHKGTDFAISDEGVMAQGVAVQAAAAGTVLRVRDGVPDRRVEDQTAKDAVEGIECGNGVVIDHGNGWETQYCHLRNGSVVAKPDTQVEAGTILGMVGESGLASFPHVHLSVRYQGEIVDPFVGVTSTPGCNVPRNPLWSQSLDYVPTGLVRAGFAQTQPELETLWSGHFTETLFPREIPALLFWVQAYGVVQGDRELFRMIAPNGDEIVNHENEVEQSNRIWMSYVGKRNTAERPILPGVWRGEYRLTRGDRVLIELQREVEVQ